MSGWSVQAVCPSQGRVIPSVVWGHHKEEQPSWPKRGGRVSIQVGRSASEQSEEHDSQEGQCVGRVLGVEWAYSGESEQEQREGVAERGHPPVYIHMGEGQPSEGVLKTQQGKEAVHMVCFPPPWGVGIQMEKGASALGGRGVEMGDWSYTRY